MQSSPIIEQLEGVDAQAIPTSVLQSSRPLLLKGFVKQWPAVQKAQSSDQAISDYVRSFYNGEPLTAYEGAATIEGRIFYNDDLTGFNFERTRQDLNAVLDKLLSCAEESPAPTYYVGSTMVDHWLPGFRSENDIALGTDESLVSIWIGNRSRIAAHYDFPDNIACVVAGRRRFTLFPPEQIDNLYIGPLDFTPSGQAISMVDTSNPDLQRFPKYAQAMQQAVVFDVEAGDAVFIPSMWWHHVESLESFNVLVNYWWRTTPAYLGAPANALLNSLLSMRDLPQAQKQIWKNLFDYYVFGEQETKFDHIPENVRGILATLDSEKAQAIKTQLQKFLK
jgi:hypothetical protein